MKKTTHKALRLDTSVVRTLAHGMNAVAGGTNTWGNCPGPLQTQFLSCPTWGVQCPTNQTCGSGGSASGGGPIGGHNLQ
jgi:hypothetical protein